jgi:hypothetical protein
MALENLPPQDLEAESSCIASVLLSKDALSKVSGILEVDDFYLDKHRVIYESILELERKNSPIDLLTLKQRLSDKNLFDSIGGERALVELYRSVSTSANAEFYAGRIKELSIRRKIINVSTEVIEKCYDKARDTDELVDEIESEEDHQVSHRPVVAGDPLDRVDAAQGENGNCEGSRDQDQRDARNGRKQKDLLVLPEHVPGGPHDLPRSLKFLHVCTLFLLTAGCLFSASCCLL